MAALTWPAAVVYVSLIVAVGTVLSVTIWSVFRTGQTAIKNERRELRSAASSSASPGASEALS